MAGGGFVYKEGTRLYMKPAVLPTSTTYYIGSVMVRSGSEAIEVSTTTGDTTLSVLIGGMQPYANSDYCATSDKKLQVAVEGIVWVRSYDSQSWTWMAPVYNAQTANTLGTVQTSNASSATVVGFYICDKDGNVGKDRTTTTDGELIGVLLDIYPEAT